mgnify:CR=1 FL=1
MSLRIVRVAVPVPLHQLFSYLVPEEVDPQPGCRVLVGFGPRKLVGLVVEGPSEDPPEDVPLSRLRPFEALLDPDPALSPTLRALCGWLAGYYHVAPGEAYMLPLPPAMTGGRAGTPRVHQWKQELWASPVAAAERPTRMGVKMTRVLDWLEIKAEEEKLKGVMDLTRVAHFGHSAGAGCAMMLAGATRNYVCAQSFTADQGAIVPCDVADLVSKVEPRIKAVLAFSPQGPNNDGFMTESFATVGIPVLIATGQGDGDAPGEPENRKQVFELMGASEDAAHRFMLFIDDPGAQHTFFEAEVKACQKVTTEERCDEMQTWLVASALAFLDHQLRGRVQALTWLTSGSVEELSRSTASLTRK